MSSSDTDEFEVIDQLEGSLSTEELAKVQVWLQPTDYEAQSNEFHRHLSSQAPGTGLWICETSKYQQWQSATDHGSLWIKGAPGAGKSVIAASMIENLQNNDSTPVLYFFFRYIISANRRPRSLIRDFLAQLLPFSACLQATLQPLVGTDLENFSDEILWEHLLTGLSSTKKAYCVIDALDEMELLPNDHFLDRLNKLAAFRPNVKLLMTSRPKQHLQSSLRDTSIVHISLENDLVGRDIGLFVSYRLKSVLPGDHQQNLRQSLAFKTSERSRGLFLYARLLLDQIIPSLEPTELDIERLMKTIPIGLEEMYNSMLAQQAEALKIDIRIQVFLLELATHSSRALRLNEMANALASAFPSSMIPNSPKFVTRLACAPLLEISEDETVQVIHHSFTEFLLNKERVDMGHASQFPVLNPDEVHKKLTISCLDYLTSGVLRVEKSIEQHKKDDNSTDDNNDKENDQYDYQEAKLRHPFLEYAVRNWAYHASKYDFEDEEFFQSVAGFLDPSSPDFRKWLELEWWRKEPRRWGENRKSKDQIPYVQAPTPLHIAAFAGLTKHAKKLIVGQDQADSRDSEDRTPLHWACARGHTVMASILLENGAAANAEDCRGVKPIHEAARKNHSSIVRLLLEAGVNPLTPKTREDTKRFLMCGEISTKGETAVEYAWLQGHTDTIMEMLPFITPETLGELFCQCCRYGKFEAVRAILEASGVSPNTEWNGASALYLACRAQNVAVIELLLAKGADVHRTSEWLVPNRNACGHGAIKEPLRTPIHATVIGWKIANHIACQQILRLLLNAGAGLEVKDANEETPLLSLFNDQNAADDIVARGLLQAGADVLAVDRNGDSIVHRYLLNGSKNIQTLKLFFEYGARIDSLGQGGQTIIHRALQSSYGDQSFEFTAASIDFLLEKGARCDIKDEYGCTTVESAATNSDCPLETFTILLQACFDADVLKRCMWKLSSRRNQEETVKFIRALQKLGVSLEDRDDSGGTALLASVGSVDLFDAFIECGADLNAVDSTGKGVLHHYLAHVARHRGRLDNYAFPQRFVDMINMGLDPLKVDHEGNNLLHLHSKHYAGEETDNVFVQKFLDYGISVNSRNNQGMTPLHVYLENWDFHATKSVYRNHIHERFDERFEIPLLKLFRRSQDIFDINSQDVDGLTIFHLTALRSHARVFYLLEEGADPSLLTKKGRSALHLACRARQSNIVEYLCQIGQSLINQRDLYGRTPLHDACTSGIPESVRHLLEAGADTAVLDNNKRTPLHSCAEFSDEQRIWALLHRRNEVSGHLFQDRFRPVPSKSYEHPCYTPSVRATSELHHEDNPSIGLTIRSLLLAGSDAAATDSNSRTPLDLAIEYDCQEMVQALQFSIDLVRKNWSIDAKDQTLETVIMLKDPYLSTKRLSEFSLEQIIHDPSTYLPYLTLNDLEWISKNGGSITGRDEMKPTPSSRKSLMYIAASKGFTHLIRSFGQLARANDDPEIVLAQIMELFSDPEHYPEIKYLPPTLHIACTRELSNLDMIEVLVDTCGVDVNARAIVQPTRRVKVKEVKDLIRGGTALHILAKANNWWQLKAVKYLIQKGAKIDSINEKGETPLQVACTGPSFPDMNCTPCTYGFWRIDCVQLLLDQGANIHHLDNDGLSCLHKACSSPQILRLLLENGADLTAGKISPVFPAIQIQCLEALNILLDAGVSPNVRDNNKDHDGFSVDYKAKRNPHWLLYCASFANLRNQKAENSVPMVKLLIDRGADLYAPLNDKETLVHYAFEHAEYEILSAFLDCKSKIDFNSRDHQGRTIFLAACEWREVLPGYKHRHWEAKATAPFLRILEFGVDPLAVDNRGRNALHCLLDNPEMEDEAIVQFLGHDVAKTLFHQKDEKGFAPFDCALRLLRPAVVEVLLTMGADLLSPDPTGATALHHIAAQCLHSRRKLNRRTWGNEYTADYYTDLLALWKKFLALGGSINIRDSKGSPPLFYYLSASQRDDYKAPENSCCHVENFAIYFSEGVAEDLDIFAKNNDGENVLHIIARREKNMATKPTHDKPLFELFVSKGLNPLEEDEKGRSSLDVAAACDQKRILELFHTIDYECGVRSGVASGDDPVQMHLLRTWHGFCYNGVVPHTQFMHQLSLNLPTLALLA
ncbi:Ankyrin [Venustampulla echinocandica]|uniref:Ankyrin n=1 Tax=Venustampulla echinocandica TaxID=2656787 RepID=A0A370TD90_9HELO|nr:Ankyrin [Venustampulla echinocandica]RDL32415.1 Ankyrin [Venustampulla echinocandica]